MNLIVKGLNRTDIATGLGKRSGVKCDQFGGGWRERVLGEQLETEGMRTSLGQA